MKLDEHLDKYNRIKLEEKKRKIEKMLTIWGKCNQYATGCSYNKKRENEPSFLTLEDENLYLLVSSTVNDLKNKDKKLFDFAFNYYVGFKFIDGGYEEDINKKTVLCAKEAGVSVRTIYRMRERLINLILSEVGSYF